MSKYFLPSCQYFHVSIHDLLCILYTVYCIGSVTTLVNQYGGPTLSSVIFCLFFFLPITSSRNEHRKVKIWPLYLNLCTPDLSNRTKPNKKPIELQSFDWVRQSNTYFAVSSIFEPIEPIQSTKIEQNRTNPMQLSLDASN